MAAQEPPAAAGSAAPAAVVEPQGFDSPGEAADAPIDRFDVAVIRIMGGGQKKVVLTGEKAQDREQTEAFAAQARERKEISVSPGSSSDVFDEAMGEFALAYADQAEHVHAALKVAVRQGKISVYRES